MSEVTLNDMEAMVRQLEFEIYEQTECEYFNISLITNGLVIIIQFIGIEIWNSENDDREEFENDDKTDCYYEDLEGFIRKRIMDEIKKLNKIDVSTWEESENV